MVFLGVNRRLVHLKSLYIDFLLINARITQDFPYGQVTGNKYPSTVKEKAKLAPDVHRFIQNLDKEGMLEGKKPKKKKV